MANIIGVKASALASVVAGYINSNTSGVTDAIKAKVPPGAPGEPGKSAYQLARDAGYGGTEAQWRATLRGDQGTPGTKGDKGDKGEPGQPGSGGTGTGTPVGIFPMYQALDGSWSGPVNPKTRTAGQAFMWSVREGGSAPTESAGFLATTDMMGPVGLTGATGATPPTGGTTTQPPAAPTSKLPPAASVFTAESFTRPDGPLPTTPTTAAGAEADQTAWATDAKAPDGVTTFGAPVQARLPKAAGLAIAGNCLAIDGAAALTVPMGGTGNVGAAQITLVKLPTAGSVKFEVRDSFNGYKQFVVRVGADGTTTVQARENFAEKFPKVTLGVKAVAGDVIRIHSDLSAATVQVLLSGTKVHEQGTWQVVGGGNYVIVGGDAVTPTGTAQPTAGAVVDNLVIDKATPVIA